MKRVSGAHEAVLCALENAYHTHGRAVAVAEIIDAMPLDVVQLIRTGYAKPLNIAVSSVLAQLMKKRTVLSPGISGRQRFYLLATSVFNESEILMPDVVSRRRRVLAFARKAVAFYGRAVRAVDVSNYIESQLDVVDLTPLLVVRDLRNLAATGELQLYAVRGDSRGFNTYLPIGMNAELYQAELPLTWLQEVERAFDELWTERLQAAVDNNRLPRPIGTSEVRARLVAAPAPHPNLQDIRLLANALLQLAQSKRPTIRKLKRKGQWATLWAPFGVLDCDLDIACGFATNAERIHEATRRAVERHNRPVTIQDMAAEIDLDDALRPDGTVHIRVMASDSAKPVLTAKAGVQRQRANRAVRHVGRAGGTAYYVGNTDVQEGALYVSFLEIENWWVGFRADEQLSELDGCKLPGVAIGRAKHIEAETEALAGTLSTLLRSVPLDAACRAAASKLYESVSEVLERTRLWLNGRAQSGLELPELVSVAVPGLTAEQLLLIVEPLYPKAREVSQANRLVTLLDGDIRRVPNPNHISRFCDDPQQAAEYLFDRADALIFIAKEWGSMEARFQANVASAELGLLRDPSFVLPALESKDFEQRLVAVACLAFLRATPDVVTALKQMAANDKESGVRVGAMWALRLASSNLEQLSNTFRE